MSPTDVNDLNSTFWEQRSALIASLLLDQDVLAVAMTDLDSESVRNIPLQLRKPLEQALENAENARVLFKRTFARRGGKATKSDSLQTVIIAVVRRTPAIKVHELLCRLQAMAKDGHPTIVRVDRKSELLPDQHQMIHYHDATGRQKAAPVSGLKDRLSRARKKIDSR